MTDEECGTLPVYHDGTQCISCWRLSEEELAHVNATGCVFVAQLRPLDDQTPIWVKGAAPEKAEAVEN